MYFRKPWSPVSSKWCSIAACRRLFLFRACKWWLSDAYQLGTFEARTANRLRLVRRWQVNGRRYRHMVSPCLSWVIPVRGASIGDISRALDSSAVARNLRREAPFPVFAQRLPDMISGGDRLVVPSATVCKLLAAGACAATFRPRRAFSSRRGTAAAVHASMGSQAVPEATLEDIVTR